MLGSSAKAFQMIITLRFWVASGAPLGSNLGPPWSFLVAQSALRRSQEEPWRYPRAAPEGLLSTRVAQTPQKFIFEISRDRF